MRTLAKSLPPSRDPKAQNNPAIAGILRRSTFCRRTQAQQDRKNTDAFPGFLTPPPRVPALTGNISQHQRVCTLPGTQAHPPVQLRKSIKTRNELNLTQENSWAAGEGANPAPSSVFIRVHPWPEKPYRLTRLAHLRPIPQKPGLAIHGSSAIQRHKLIDAIRPPRTRFPAIRLAIRARDRTTSRRPASLTLINVSNQIKLKRADQSVHTIG